MMLSEQHYGRGLCWSNRKLDSGDGIWGHGGSDPGISTYMGFRPKDGVGIIIFVNFGRPGDAMRRIFERLLKEAD